MKQMLSSSFLFRDISQETLNRLTAQNHIMQRQYPKGATVHSQGKRCRTLDIVEAGRLVAYSLAANGSESIVFEFEQGGVIGANLIFGTHNIYPMNIYCTADCTLVHITRAGTEELLKEHMFVMRFVQLLSSNSQQMNKRIAMYTQKNLRENLIDYLLALSIEQNTKTVILPTTKKQLADYFGVQRPSLFRELKIMKDEGLIDVADRKITIKNLAFSPRHRF
jgi:CRP-like cAMP-binding protein